MAITASIALSSATCTSGQQVTATCTVSNSGGAAVNVISLAPLVTPNGQTPQSVAVAVGVPPIGGAFSQSVAASGTLAISFSVVPHAPTTSYGLAEPASYVYAVGALVTTSDGALTSASTSTLTVANPALT